MNPKTQHTDELVSTSKTQARSGEAHLPKLQLTHFNGDVLQWQSFGDNFRAIIDCRGGISDLSKFSYLLASLKEEVKTCPQGLVLTEANYDDAKQLLVKRFGRKEIRVVTHIQKPHRRVSTLLMDEILRGF